MHSKNTIMEPAICNYTIYVYTVFMPAQAQFTHTDTCTHTHTHTHTHCHIIYDILALYTNMHMLACYIGNSITFKFKETMHIATHLLI